MYESGKIKAPTKEAFYQELLLILEGLLADERDWLANLANASALLYDQLPNLNWAGFYLLKHSGDLVLGPFQGKPACTRIPQGRGVCGTAASQGKTVLIPDVHEFPRHIACDPRSRSELVLPLLIKGQVWGVLDLDSPVKDRFDAQDAQGLEKVAAKLAAIIE